VTRRRAALAAWLAAAAVAAATACDPCTGTATCSVSPRVSYTGKVIDFGSGRGAPGVAVGFRRTSGGAVAGDSLSAVTDGEGRYTLRADAVGGGDVVGELTVRPPAPLPPYTVRGVRLAQSSVGGGGGVLPTFVTQPYVDFVGELRYRRSGGPLAYSGVTFTRTGGGRLSRGDTLTTAAGADGWFYLEAPAVGADTVVGDLAVKYYEFSRPLIVRGVRLPVRYTDRLPSLDRSLRLGTALDYTAEFRYRATQTPVIGAEVEFRRTGGLPLQQQTFVGRTDLNGQLVLVLTPTSETAGEVVGDVTVRPPAPAAPFVIRGVRVRSYDSDELPFLGVLGIGFQAVAAGELILRGDRSRARRRGGGVRADRRARDGPRTGLHALARRRAVRAQPRHRRGRRGGGRPARARTRRPRSRRGCAACGCAPPPTTPCASWAASAWARSSSRSGSSCSAGRAHRRPAGRSPSGVLGGSPSFAIA
jgi:hypothetical protein